MSKTVYRFLLRLTAPEEFVDRANPSTSEHIAE
ncbi:hypothetical protein D2E25_1508 [Bifidobacterium goeldii]|uniref:Uncharacterized protein n=1 Tax=Bifidobacterium goeldii TaxID=2306975 RepID=A0A430FJE1_9BIFI|nr:hypothetical protein D2E25_1508 [Bifidobacterium goeldii]